MTTRTPRLRFVDSHTEGEPTRVFLDDGGTGLFGRGESAAALARRWRAAGGPPSELLALVAEPRAPVATVGVVLCPPEDPLCATGVVFVNAAGLLGMCGHGTIGLAVTLVDAGRIGLGEHRFETPVGVVAARVVGDGAVEVDNVPAFRHRAAVALDVDGRTVTGDVAWGGNWFFLVETDRHLDAAEPETLLAETKRIRAALARAGVSGSEGAPIDHVALIERASRDGRDPRNFVLCPNDAYDRSPCGTGTSARLACLAAAGRLEPEVRLTQRSLIGSRFDAWYRPDPSGVDRVLPTIAGRAWVVAEGSLRLDASDPSRGGGWHETH